MSVYIIDIIPLPGASMRKQRKEKSLETKVQSFYTYKPVDSENGRKHYLNGHETQLAMKWK